MKFYTVEKEYLEFLSKIDSKVILNSEIPYVGIVLNIENHNYFAPLAANKDLKENIYIVNLKESDSVLGSIKLNNMIPIEDKFVSLMSVKDLKDEKYKNLLNKQYEEIKSKENKILSRAKDTYIYVTEKKHPFFTGISCDFKILEEAKDIYVDSILKGDDPYKRYLITKTK